MRYEVLRSIDFEAPHFLSDKFSKKFGNMWIYRAYFLVLMNIYSTCVCYF